MSLKLSILVALVVSLLAAPLAQRATAQPAAVKMPGCAMMTCVSGCCAMMPCCAKSPREQTEPVQSPAPPRTDLQFAAIGLHVFSLLYALPVPPRTFVILDEASAGHTLPPRAANCIQLI
jgi:hypothetical protein